MKKAVLIFLLFVLTLTSVSEVQAGDPGFSRRFFGFNVVGAYVNDVFLNGTSSLFSGISSTLGGAAGIVPKNALGIGGSIEFSVPIGKRWAFRPVAGYQFIAWHSNSVTPPQSPYNHSLSADLLFDVYLNSTSKFHPYFSVGPGIRHTIKPLVTLGGGAHYEINDNWTLKGELKLATLGLWTNVEPVIGLGYGF
jgi:hypothetical protein